MLTILKTFGQQHCIPNILKALLRFSTSIKCFLYWFVHVLCVILVTSGKGLFWLQILLPCHGKQSQCSLLQVYLYEDATILYYTCDINVIEKLKALTFWCSCTSSFNLFFLSGLFCTLRRFSLPHWIILQSL